MKRSSCLEGHHKGEKKKKKQGRSGTEDMVGRRREECQSNNNKKFKVRFHTHLKVLERGSRNSRHRQLHRRYRNKRQQKPMR
ncbi:hypothetical protein HKD37_12G034620 [Glycine soja]